MTCNPRTFQPLAYVLGHSLLFCLLSPPLCLNAVEHPVDGLRITHVAPVSPTILGIVLEEREVQRGGQIPYVAAPGDSIQEEGNTRLVSYHGKAALKGNQVLYRDLKNNGKLKKVGVLVEDSQKIALDDTIVGQRLTLPAAQEPSTYRIRSRDDPRFSAAPYPVAVHRKSKPIGPGSLQAPVRHWLYLELPHPLKEGATYTIEFSGVNTVDSSYTFQNQSVILRSEAIHVSQVGYRPDDPLKRAYLSCWMGSGGGVTYGVDRFILVDDHNQTPVYEGWIQLGISAGQTEPMRGKRNFSNTNVYYLDFSDFNQPGRFRVHVPGIGTSYPFTINDEVWRDAFKISMQGLLHHRSGIALGPPFTQYQRPRPFHPADGVNVYHLKVTGLEGESGTVKDDLLAQLGGRMNINRLNKSWNGWGGWMDAGDWDRNKNHLKVAMVLLELYELNPPFFQDFKFALPPAEAEDNLPDLLNEALWGVDFYYRLQQPEGGVCSGIESTAHPRTGEASFQESLLIGQFAPDPLTSIRFAALAARASRLLTELDATRAGEYQEAAERAWTWAHAQRASSFAQIVARGHITDTSKFATQFTEAEVPAALELYWLTGNEAYHSLFRENIKFSGDQSDEALDATFTYARMPQARVNKTLQTQAHQAILRQADKAIQFSQANGFNLAVRNKYLPMIGYVGYWSTPETSIGPVLPRAYHLTNDPKYLSAALAATQYGVGANPMNQTMTTGVGLNYPRYPLHVDSRVLGIDAPTGITVYGQPDPQGNLPDWVKTWYLAKLLYPPREAWPATEFYLDLRSWPEMNEYTVHQTICRNAYYWGAIAARKTGGRR